MEIINATWEKRNFGYDVFEIVLSKEDCDNINETIDKINQIDAKYITVKLPVNNINMLHTLQVNGYFFMENLFDIYIETENYETPEKFTSIANKAFIKEYSKDVNQWERVVNNIDKAMFSTDRIYLDPMLDISVSLNRYRNWSMDLFHDENTILHTIHTKDDAEIGYGICKVKEGTSHLVLTGIYKNYQNLGFGSLIVDTPIKIAKSKRIRRFSTTISSNNRAMARYYAAFGFLLDDIKYVLRKIKD